MNENELELLLSSKIKSCVDGRHLPDGFAERMVAEVRRAKRAFRFRVVTLSAVVIALSSILMGFLTELPRQETKEPSLIAAHEGGTKEKISGWVLLGFFKECFKRVRTNKRKEEY